MERVKNKILILSGKGGVGKSTVAVNLATSLATNGYSVGLLDVDIHGPSIPKMLGIENENLSYVQDKIQPVIASPNLSVISMAFLLSKDAPVIWRGPLKMKAIDQFINDVEWGELDYLIIDSPPGTGDEPLSVAQLLEKLDGAIIVTTPQDLALLDSRRAVNFVRQLEIPVIGILENMSGFICPHCGKRIDLFKVGGGERAARELGVPFLGRIPIEPQIVSSGDEGLSFIHRFGDTEAAKAFQRVAQLCEGFVEEGKHREKILD